MESQTGETLGTLSAGLEKLEARLEAAASLLERTLALLEERHSTITGEVQKIVAAVEHQQPSGREPELERKLEAAEQRIAELQAQMERTAAEAKPVRRTVPASTAQFLTKQGISTLDSLEAGALDAALTGLSLEQRIAVKAQLLRAGVLNGSV
jgi:DNA repair exonuclease SbcCD ATPase subunit